MKFSPVELINECKKFHRYALVVALLVVPMQLLDKKDLLLNFHEMTEDEKMADHRSRVMAIASKLILNSNGSFLIH